MTEKLPSDGSNWHRNSSVYQVYVPSFNSHDGRSMGTIQGIKEKVPYLEELGVDAVWLTPFYTSPWVDGGYDVSSYREVDPRFGSMQDFKELLDTAHDRGLKVMVDFVPNHMSTESDWYKEASSSRTNPKSDWFVFRDLQPDGSLPNNWLSEFRERRYDEATGQWTKHPRSVWQYVPARDQYVMCTFTAQQADLNWHNPKVRAAMKDEMQFLLDLGVDGFRVDMITHIGKHPNLLDEPINPNYDPACGDPNESLLRKYRNSDPTMYQYLHELVALLGKEHFMITEDYVARDDPVRHYLNYYENVDPKKCAPFSFENFEFMMPRTASAYKKFYDEYMAATSTYVPTTVLGNHDQSRIATRAGKAAARAMAITQLTLPGMAFIYNGEELGMEDVYIPKHLIQDPHDGRDPERTPILWDATKNAGFTTGKPWLPVTPGYEYKNAQAQLGDPRSFLSLYKRLLHMRRSSPALHEGTYIPLETGHDDVYGFMRASNLEQLRTVTNFSKEEAEARVAMGMGKVIVSSLSDAPLTGRIVNLDGLWLRPDEAVIIKALQ